MSRALEALGLACILLLAGCVGMGGEDAAGEGNETTIESDSSNQGSGPDATSGDSDRTRAGANETALNESSLFDRPRATRLDETNVSDWFSATGSVGPQAPVTAFKWRIPEGAVVERETFFDQTEETVVVEAVRRSSGDIEVEAWGALFFDLSGPNATLLSSITDVPTTITQRTPVETTENESGADLEGFVTYLGSGDLDVGDEVGVVLTARGGQEGKFGMAFRALPEAPSGNATQPEIVKDVKTGASERPVELPQLASGSGFHVALYLDLNVLSIQSFTVQSEPVEVQENRPVDPRPMASVRDLTVTSQSATDPGWGIGSAFYSAWYGAHEWSASASVHGESVEGSGVLVDATFVPAVTSATILVFGYPNYFIEASGPGVNQGQYEMTGASANALSDIISYSHLDLGLTTEEMFSMPAETQAFGPGGLADPPRQQATYDKEAGTWTTESKTLPTMVWSIR